MTLMTAQRLNRRHFDTMRHVLEAYAMRSRLDGDLPESRAARRLMKALPTHMPYTLELYPHEWATLSRALRMNGNTPEAGTFDATAHSLYQMLVRKGFKHPSKDKPRNPAARSWLRQHKP